MLGENTPVKTSSSTSKLQKLLGLANRVQLPWKFERKVYAPMVASVEKFYRHFQYPNYPLLFSPRWQEGYLAASCFSHRLAYDLKLASAPTLPADEKHILVAGCGEILPLVIRKQEGRVPKITCVDLSQPSMKRARLRLARFGLSADFVADDIATYVQTSITKKRLFHHIDAYGILHHLPNPLSTFKQMTKALAPQGTMRLMVYNASARRWIQDIQSALSALKLSPYKKSDMALARKIIGMLPRYSPLVKERLAGMGASIISNNARFADTFLHPREANIELSAWLNAIEQSGLKIAGIFDRYGELDDLPNPLWKIPDVDELTHRAEVGDFCNNLEIFLVNPARPQSTENKVQRWFDPKKSANTLLDFSQMLSFPPKFWTSFPETQSLSRIQLQLIWSAHLAHTRGMSTIQMDLAGTLNQLPISAIRRLARIGALLPQMIPDTFKQACEAPLAMASRSVTTTVKVSLQNTDLAKFLKELFYERDLKNEKRYLVALKRLERAIS